MTVLQFNEETEALLRSKGLRCICQLCDCGRPHKHQGCRRIHPNQSHSTTSDRGRMKTDYQCRFGEAHYVEPPKPIKPIEKPRNPHPPPMDFRTENHVSFKDFGNIKKPEICTMKQGELDQLGRVPFQGKSIYDESYIGYNPKRVNMTRPKTVIKRETGKSSFETEYHKGFPAKQKVPQQCFNEKPTQAQSLIYPDSSTVPQKSYKNLIHNGDQGEKVEILSPYKSSVHLGFDDEFDYSTTKSIEFQKYDKVQPARSQKPLGTLKTRGKFNARTSNKLEYSYNKTDAENARGQLCSEYPSLIKISMDEPSNFNTITSMSYNGWKDEKYKSEKVNSTKKREYTPPKEKFQSKTQNQMDFQSYSLPARVFPIKPIPMKKSNDKIEAHSSYDHEFPAHGQVKRVVYGSQHVDNLHLPPKDRKFDSSTVMKSDFQKSVRVEKLQSFKPSYKMKDGGDFYTATEYNDMFKPNNLQECVFPHYLVTNDMK